MSATLPNVREWYEVNGVELATHGYMIYDIQKGIPGRKGTNVEAAIIHGEQWREKRFAPRQETWSIWITGDDPVTGQTASASLGELSQYNANYDTVINLLTPSPQLLEVIHYRIDPTDPNFYETRVAYGEVISAINISENRDLNYCEFAVDVNFPDPRWFSPSQVSASASFNAPSASFALPASDIGTAPVSYMEIEFVSTGDLDEPHIVNLTYPNSTADLGYKGTIPTGQSVIINTDALTVKKEGVNVIGSLSRAGERQDWFELFPRQNIIDLQCQSGSGYAIIRYRKAYF